VLRGNEVTAPGNTTPAGADAGDIYVNATSGTIYYWDGASWQLTTSDNLGNHTATENIQIAGNWISSDGDNEGIIITPTGSVGVGANSSPNGRALSIYKDARPDVGFDINLESVFNLDTNFTNPNNRLFSNYFATIIGANASGRVKSIAGNNIIVNQNTGNTLTTENIFGQSISLIAGALADNAYGLYLDDVSGASINNYSIYAGLGTVRLGELSGTGNRMVVADADGVLSTQTIPGTGTGGTDNQDLSLNGTILSLTNDATTVDLAGLVGAADNLGDHTATENIQTAGNWLSNDGDSEGIFVAANGAVGIGMNDPQGRALSIYKESSGGFAGTEFNTQTVFNLDASFTNTATELYGHTNSIRIGGSATGNVRTIIANRINVSNSATNPFTMKNLIGQNISLDVVSKAENAYGLKVEPISGASATNFSIYTGLGDVRFGDLKGTGDRMVVADADGILTTQAIPSGGTGGAADNLGDHTATENIQTAGNWLSNDGDSEGIFVAANGAVGIGMNDPQGRALSIYKESSGGFAGREFNTETVFNLDASFTNTATELYGHTNSIRIGGSATGNVRTIIANRINVSNSATNPFTMKNLIGQNISLDAVSKAENAYGLKVEPISGASATNYAIYTGLGNIRFGDLKGSGEGVVMADADGILQKKKMPRNFTSSHVGVAANSTGVKTVNLKARYTDIFGSPVASSAGSSGLPSYTASELEYYVTFVDDTVIDKNSLSINASGILTYTVISVDPSNLSYIEVTYATK